MLVAMAAAGIARYWQAHLGNDVYAKRCRMIPPCVHCDKRQTHGGNVEALFAGDNRGAAD